VESSKYSLDFEQPIRELYDQLETLRKLSTESDVNVETETRAIEAKIRETQERIYRHLTAWQKIRLVRHPRRPYALDYVADIFQDFQELHGDRLFGDDQALVGGIASFEERPVVVVAEQKGRNLKENLRRNFGSPHPEGYRKALRLMRMAEKFDLPVISFIDTPGAYPGIGAEERHVAEAIAVNLREMSTLTIPTVGIVISEGGSGGALGIAVCDRILILENAYYSVISPEGCAAILWKDPGKAPEAAEALKLSANDLKKFKIVDEIIPEPLNGAHQDPSACARSIRKVLIKHLNELLQIPVAKRLEMRYMRYRSVGVFSE
jgi:acetyl-CoA carboxylase carboxyl transferase subunit alpha